MNSLAHTKWNCIYHIVVFIPKYRRKVMYAQVRKGILRGYCRPQRGANTHIYIKNQTDVDKREDGII